MGASAACRLERVSEKLSEWGRTGKSLCGVAAAAHNDDGGDAQDMFNPLLITLYLL